ncbi:MAG: hypothetical protein HY273_16075 [Gammaproteobacteria bacterium]|nr:hypothetical protein [Gammaproteobacteria bacterium]
MFRIITLLLVLTSLYGCSTSTKYLRPDGVTAQSLSPTTGILVGSISRSRNAIVNVFESFNFKNVTTGESNQIASKHNFIASPDDFVTNESLGAIFIFSLPAGHYSFNYFRIFQQNLIYSTIQRPTSVYSIPFEVHANTINYVGEIKLDPEAGKVFKGISEQTEYYWIISDQSNRDIELFKHLRPDIPLNSFVSVIPNTKEIFTPFVILPDEMKKYQRENSH